MHSSLKDKEDFLARTGLVTALRARGPIAAALYADYIDKINPVHPALAEKEKITKFAIGELQ
jgi:hypothetical protein